ASKRIRGGGATTRSSRSGGNTRSHRSKRSWSGEMDRTFLLAGAGGGGIGVAVGAFWAHGARRGLSPGVLPVLATGGGGHTYHALGLLLAAALAGRFDGRSIVAAGWLFVAGIVLFSGSLYVLAVTGVTTFGAITPIGGVAFLAGWLCLAVAAL